MMIEQNESPPPVSPSLAPVHSSPPARRGASRTAKIIAAGSAIAVTLWIGVRVVQAVAEKRAAQPAVAGSASPASPTAKAPAAAEVVRGEARTWQPTVALEGTLAPIRETDLGFATGGRLSRVAVKVGADVREGAVLAVLDGAPAAAQAKLAEAQIRAAEAQLGLADDANKRTGDLVQSGTAPQATLVQVGKQRDLAAAQLDAARAQLVSARIYLANHSIVAPFGGSITMAPSAPGAIVAPGVPLFHLSDTSRLRLVGSVGEADAALVKPGLEIAIAAGGRALSGKIVAVLSAVDPATRRVRVEAELDNDKAAPVLAGTFARGTVRGGAPVSVLRFPSSVLRPGSQDEVLVATPAGVVPRRVELVMAGGDLLVRSGVAAGEALVVAPSPTGVELEPPREKKP